MTVMPLKYSIKFHKRFPPKQIAKNSFVDTESRSRFIVIVMFSL